jgi:GntR family transcriptional regulator, galactonate operon transcriptional repressor
MTSTASSPVGRTHGYRSDGLHGRLVHALGTRIASGRLGPGESLPTEAALEVELGSGRSAVREAVKVLTAKGLVRSRTRTGTVVQPQESWNLLDPDVLAWRYENDPTDKQLLDLAGLRVALEPEAARLAARSKDSAARAAVREAYLRMEETVADTDAFIAADLVFHRAVVAAGGNDLLLHLNDLMSVAFAAARQVHTRNVRRNRRTLPAHRAVLEAITGHHPEEAADLMRALVTSAQHDIRRERTKPRGLTLRDPSTEQR